MFILDRIGLDIFVASIWVHTTGYPNKRCEIALEMILSKVSNQNGSHSVAQECIGSEISVVIYMNFIIKIRKMCIIKHAWAFGIRKTGQ